MSVVGRRLGPYVLVVLAGALGSCSKLHEAPEGGGPLPPPPPGPLPMAGEAPALPFDDQLGDGAYARDVFGAAGPPGTEVAIRDLLIGPRAEGRLPGAPGPVVIDVHSGSGSAIAGGRTLELSVERPVSLPAGTSASLTNSGETPLSARLYYVIGRK